MDVYDSVNDLIYDQLNLSDYYIDNAERLGQLKSNFRGQKSSKKTILVSFRYAHEVSSIMANARNLAGTDIIYLSI
jgi:hypothetical protein